MKSDCTVSGYTFGRHAWRGKSKEASTIEMGGRLGKVAGETGSTRIDEARPE